MKIAIEMHRGKVFIFLDYSPNPHPNSNPSPCPNPGRSPNTTLPGPYPTEVISYNRLDAEQTGKTQDYAGTNL